MPPSGPPRSSATACGSRTDVDDLLHQARRIQQALAIAAILRSKLQRISAVAEVGGNDESALRRVVHHIEVVRNLSDGATSGRQRDAYRSIRTGYLDFAARQREGTSGSGACILRTGGSIRHAADVDGRAFLTDDVDGGALDGLAQFGTHLEIHHDGVLLPLFLVLM